jgi:hypothetical protein
MGRNVHFTTILLFCTSRYIATITADFTHVVHLGVWSLAEKAPDEDCKKNLFYSCRRPLTDVSSVNIPWPEKGMGDADYVYAFQKIVMPIAMEFAPELVISTSRTLSFVLAN